MANHVYFNMEIITNLTDEQWDESFLEEETTRQWGDNEPHQVIEFLPLENQPFMQQANPKFDKDGNLEDSWNWYVDNVGAKWCNVDEASNGYITGYSAWSPPYTMAQNIANYITEKYGETVYIKMTYEDEFRNFIGVYNIETVLREDGTHYLDDEDNYQDDGDITCVMEEVLGEGYADNDEFEWHEPCKNLLSGEEIYPYEYLDEVVYNFFETGDLVPLD